MVLSFNKYLSFSKELKAASLSVIFHAALFLGAFSFNKIYIHVSNIPSSSSFNVMSVSSATNEGVSKEKQIKEKITKKPVNNNPTNNQNENQIADSSSEVIFDSQDLNNVQPQYPISSKRKGEEGTVLIRAFIDESGNALNIEIVKSSSYSALDNAALNAIKKWHFIPAKKFGHNISSSVIIPVTFQLT